MLLVRTFLLLTVSGFLQDDQKAALPSWQNNLDFNYLRQYFLSFFGTSKEDISKHAKGTHAPLPIIPDPEFEYYS